MGKGVSESAQHNRKEEKIKLDNFSAELSGKSALERQAVWQETFRYLDEPLDQSRFLMQLGMEKPSLPEIRRKECRIAGCKTNIWRKIYVKDGRIVFQADSDSLIIKGILWILTDIFHSARQEEAAVLRLSSSDTLDPAVLNPDIKKGGLSVLMNELKNLKGEL